MCLDLNKRVFFLCWNMNIVRKREKHLVSFLSCLHFDLREWGCFKSASFVFYIILINFLWQWHVAQCGRLVAKFQILQEANRAPPTSFHMQHLFVFFSFFCYLFVLFYLFMIIGVWLVWDLGFEPNLILIVTPPMLICITLIVFF